MMGASWIASAPRDVVTVARMLGLEVRRSPSAHHCACPACRASRRHASRGDRRGAVGISHTQPTGWRCHVCGVGGDSVDMIAYVLCGQRMRDLSAEQRREVRSWIERHGGGIAHRDTVARVESVREPVYPPRDELSALARELVPVTDHDAATAYLRWRGIDPEVVERRGLVRALPGDASTLPRWATLGARTWAASRHQLIVPLYDCAGRLRSVLARSVERAPTLKSTAPSGYERGGLVMANEQARALLSGASTEPTTVLIREGEIDYLESACADDVAVLGIVSGSWSARVAARIPDGSHVIVATDADEAGDRYAHAIAATLTGRVQLTRERWAA